MTPIPAEYEIVATSCECYATPVSPDGLTVDAEGYVWCAHWFGGCVVRYDPGTDNRTHRVSKSRATTDGYRAKVRSWEGQDGWEASFRPGNPMTSSPFTVGTRCTFMRA